MIDLKPITVFAKNSIGWQGSEYTPVWDSWKHLMKVLDP